VQAIKKSGSVGSLPIVLALIAALLGCGTHPKPAPSENPSAMAAKPLPESLRTGLARANYYRAMVGLPPLVYDPAHDYPDFNHARYVVKNDLKSVDFKIDQGAFNIVVRNFDAAHEKRDQPWFSDQGATAALWSWTSVGSVIPQDFSPMIDAAMSSPFSALTLLNPQAATVSTGQFCENGRCAVTSSYELGLNLETYQRLYEADQDVRRWNPALGRLPFTPGKLLRPIEYPPSGSAVPKLIFTADNWPDPWIACPAYKPPVGQPIILELGKGPDPSGQVEPRIHTIEDDGKEIEHCLFTSATYKSNDKIQMRWARQMLKGLGAVILLPREPLQAGHKYSVSITVDSAEYTWSFNVVGPPPAEPKLSVRNDSGQQS
jgi:hypothetical protein